MNSKQPPAPKFRKFAFLCVTMLSCCNVASIRGETVTFEDLGLASDSFENGSSLNGSFNSATVEFTSDYSQQWESWRGWSYSSKYDTTTPGFTNQYSAYVASENGTNTYGVAYLYEPEFSTIQLPLGQEPVSVDIANTTYAALSIQNGDSFARAFEDGDYFKLAIRGENASGHVLNEKLVTLAQYSNDQEYILDVWQNVDLTSMQGLGVTQLSFKLFSTDYFGNNPSDINTPAYFAMDNFELQNSQDSRIPGDANFDDIVDQTDLSILLSNYGKTSSPGPIEVSWEQGDFNADGMVSLRDLLILKKHFGDGNSSDISPNSVPEPASMVLLSFGVLCTGLIVARRRKKNA